MFDRFRRCTSIHEFPRKGGLLRCTRRRTHLRSGVYQTHEHRGKDQHGAWVRTWAAA